MEKTTLEKAIDLKGKVSGLIQAASEVSNYLTVKINEIISVQSAIEEISNATNTAQKEKESIEKVLKSLKKDYEIERKSFEEWKSSKTSEIEKIKFEAQRMKEEALELLESNKKKESALNLKLDEVDSLKRSLSSKLDKIAEIGGVR